MLGLPRGPPCSPASVPGTKPEHTSSSCGLSLSFRSLFPGGLCKCQCGLPPGTPAFLVPELWRLAVPICSRVLQEHHGLPGLSRHVW